MKHLVIITHINAKCRFKDIYNNCYIFFFTSMNDIPYVNIHTAYINNPTHKNKKKTCEINIHNFKQKKWSYTLLGNNTIL